MEKSVLVFLLLFCSACVLKNVFSLTIQFAPRVNPYVLQEQDVV